MLASGSALAQCLPAVITPESAGGIDETAKKPRLRVVDGIHSTAQRVKGWIQRPRLVNNSINCSMCSSSNTQNHSRMHKQTGSLACKRTEWLLFIRLHIFFFTLDISLCRARPVCFNLWAQLLAVRMLEEFPQSTANLQVHFSVCMCLGKDCYCGKLPHLKELFQLAAFF